MQRYPKITIITPSYNQGRFLEETILSIINQNYPNLEFIVVDGGSTDNSLDIIKKYKSAITYTVMEKDQGTYDANNKGLQIMTGDYWCVVNSDDKLKEGSLQTIGEFIVSHNFPDWITASIEYINENSQRLGGMLTCYPKKIGGMYFLNGCWIPHPVTFLSKKVYNEVGLFAKTDIMDFEYWLRCEQKGFLPKVINKELGSFRYHEDSKSMNFLNIQKQVIQLIKTYRTKLYNRSDKKELDAYIHKFEFELSQNEIKSYIYDKHYSKALGLFFLLMLNNPQELFKRWPYGMIRRFFTGVTIKEYRPDAFIANS